MPIPPMHSPSQSPFEPTAQPLPQQAQVPTQARRPKSRREVPPKRRQPQREPGETPLFGEYVGRYLRDDRVRAWLTCREPEGVRYAETFEKSLSFACLYHAPNGRPCGARGARGAAGGVAGAAAGAGKDGARREAEGELGRGMKDPSAAFLDAGDFMLFHHTYDQFAVGTLYSTQKHHSLAQLRESVGATSLSMVPKARRFVTDLSVDALEMLEFAWLQDDSLIVNCRRLRKPLRGPVDRDDALAIEGDILFYDVIPRGRNPGTPLKRMVLFEKCVICKSCGARKFHSCRCPARFKRRAPPEEGAGVAVKSARNASGPADAALAASLASNRLRASRVPLQGVSSVGRYGGAEGNQQNDLTSEKDGRRIREVSTFANFTSRLHSIEQRGAFFVRWSQRVSNTSKMAVWLEPKSPVPYHFLCGTKLQTNSLASRFIHDMRLGSDSFRSDARFYGSLTSGAGSIKAVMGKVDSRALSYSSIDDELPQQARGTDRCQRHSQTATTGGHGFVQIEPLQSGLASTNGAFLLHPQLHTSNVSPSTEMCLLPVSGMGQASTTRMGANAESFVQPELRADDLFQSLQSGVSPYSSDLSPVEVKPQEKLPVPLPVVFAPRTDLRLEAERVQDYESFGSKSGQCEQPQRSAGYNAPTGGANDWTVGSISSTPIREVGGNAFSGSARNDKLQNGGREQDEGEAPPGEEPHIVLGRTGLPACSECGAEFRKTGNLTRPIQTVHLKKRPFSCTECHARFGYKTHLKRHVRAVHKRDESTAVSCGQGSRTFRTQQQLDRHQTQAHFRSPVKGPSAAEVSCVLCGQLFAQRSNLNRHIQSVHQGFKHVCSACQSSFGQRCDLQRHIQLSADSGDAAHRILLDNNIPTRR